MCVLQYHDMGLIGSLLGTLYCGGTGYYLSPLDFVRSPPTWITAADRFRATHLQAPNFAFALTARKWKALKTKVGQGVLLVEGRVTGGDSSCRRGGGIRGCGLEASGVGCLLLSGLCGVTVGYPRPSMLM